ncbi:MAG: hypothetical protein GY696_33145 [Gammaproteobacteria bacterium]|nr:hypothetical protein [Gammaproteobacteria bacterium]
MFWKKRLVALNHRSLKPDTLVRAAVFSDASSEGAGATVSLQGTEHVCAFRWSQQEKTTSSTFRELLAVWGALKCFRSLLFGTRVQWNTDNKGVASIIPKGSMHRDLHRLAVKIFNFCVLQKIDLKAQSIPRGENERADFLSRVEDWDDWGVQSWFFNHVEQESGWAFSVDRFADSNNTHCVRFNSRFWSPGTEAVNAFTQDWAKDINWVVPPIGLIPTAIAHIVWSNCYAALVTPLWRSASFWPKLFPAGKAEIPNIWRHFIRKGEDVFRQGTQITSVFGPSFQGEVLVTLFRPV